MEPLKNFRVYNGRWVNHRPGTTIGRHSLSLAFARQLPQRGSRDGVRTIQRVARKAEGFGRFSSPLRKAFSIHRSTLPQSRIRSTAPSEREPGTPSSSRVPFNVPPGNRNVAGDFHRPYESSEIFTFHHSSGNVSIHQRGGKNLIFPLYNSFQIMYSIVEQSRKPCVKCCWNGELYGRRRAYCPR